MKKTILIGAAALGLAAVPALAFQNAAPEDKRGWGMPETRAEVETKARERFQAMDANRDGAVTQEEMKAAREARRAERRDRMFAKLDTDNNGQISKAEFTAERDRGDREGRRGWAKRGGHHRDKGAMMGFGWLDANKDGKVTLEEATARPLAHFDMIDTDKDGRISDAERNAAREAMKAKWKEKRG